MLSYGFIKYITILISSNSLSHPKNLISKKSSKLEPRSPPKETHSIEWFLIKVYLL